MLSKSLICKSTGKLRIFDLTKSKCKAFFASSTICCLAFKKLPDFEKRTPRYLYESFIAIFWPPILKDKFLFVLELNMTTFVLVTFILSFQRVQLFKVS